MNEFLIQVRNENYESAENILEKLDFKKSNCNEKYELYFFLEISKNKGISLINIPKPLVYQQTNCATNIYVQTISKINFALYNYYNKKNSDVSVLSVYLEALKSLEKIDANILKGEIIRRILEYHNDIFILKDYSFKKYTSLYKKIAFDQLDIHIADFYNLSIGIKNSDLGLSEKNYYKTLNLIENLTLSSYNNKLLIIAGNYLEEFGDKKEALKLYEKSLLQIKKDSVGINILSILASKLNIGIYYYYNNEFKKAINELECIYFFKGKLINRKKIYFDYWLSLIYQEVKDYENAYKHIKISRENQFSFNQTNHLLSIKDIQEKYQTEKKEKENLQLKQDNAEIEARIIKNRSFLIATILTLILGGIIAVLILKNSKRKRKLAEQDADLKTQKNLTLLKEQELTTINAMVDGQEKERKRIAEDLHDNLGSVLATLKLHFDNLKINREKKKINQETLFDKTENLIDEAYLKVRSIAHAKNAGVIANQGLLLAVQMMAEKISSADKIQIEVIDFGLDKRLDNSLEISIFRIIQELLTNIIKHANAKNATINISLFDKNLNIIVEDDGKGFDPSNINLKNGMGISSIKTRIEHLKGTFKIDATPGKGSSIILDVPIL
jgi:signal transduction histidine kinase